MIQLNDEILNKYIDGELDSATLLQVKELLSNSPEYRKRLSALMEVHKELKKIKVEAVNEKFTEMVMRKLNSRKKAMREQRNFLFIVLGIGGAIMAFVLGLVIFSAVTQTDGSNVSADYSQQVVSFFRHIAVGVLQLFTPKGMSIIGSIISLGILISGYFFFENLKSQKQNLPKAR